MEEKPIRLLIVEDHQVVRMGLRAIFGGMPRAVVVGEAATAEEALSEAFRLRPDIVVMDLRLSSGDGVQACRAIRSACPDTHVIVLTSYDDEDAVIGSILAGASGFVLKHTDPEQLIDAVKTVAGGKSLLHSDVTETVFRFVRSFGEREHDQALAGLSDQEHRILPLIAEGKTNREIANELFLSEHTVKTYVSNIFQKLHLARRTEAAALMARLQQERGRRFG